MSAQPTPLKIDFVSDIACPWCAVGLVATPFAIRAVGPVRRSLGGRDLIPVLRDTGRAELAYGLLLGLGLALSR